MAGGNLALKQHPFEFVDIHLTTPGSNWQWAVFAMFGASGIAALFLVYFTKRYIRGMWTLAFVIFHISFVAYYLMASGLGWTAIEVQFLHDRGTTFGGTRQINYTRFIQQTLASPIYVLILLLGAGANVEMILFGMFTQIYFWVCLLIAALISDQYKWGLFTMAVVLEFNVWAVLLHEGIQMLGARGSATKKAVFYAVTGWYILIYLLYIIAVGVSELGNVITVTAEAVFYGVLDLCIQVVMLFVFIPIFSSYIPGVGSRGAAVEGQALDNHTYTLPRKEPPQVQQQQQPAQHVSQPAQQAHTQEKIQMPQPQHTAQQGQQQQPQPA